MQWKNKKVIVTGGAGVIGQALTKMLNEKGATIRCFDIAPKPFDFPNNVEYCQRDLSLLNPIEFISFGPEVVFHLAATFERTEEDPNFWELNFTNNVLLSHKVVDAVKYCRGLEKFVFASSYLIYNPEQYLFNSPQINKLKETDKFDARNLCGAAKYYTEKELNFLDNFKEYSFSKISARIFRVYGRNSRDFVSRCIRQAINNEEIALFLKENSFDYIFADDVAEGLIKLAETNIQKGIFNLGTGNSRKIEEMIFILKTHFPQLKVKETELSGLYEGSCANMDNFFKITGWKPTTSLEQGIEKVIQYEISKKDKN